ncbi:protein tyrosine kinase domain-containing protein [Rhizoctonia solani AG-1 IA]|uniref:Protein tyrosine kinase domain-containing protein n=1 Tax=Thanatephorus cucumeris (strain AG1-IA) TaxID=983506 RepID=L8WVG9_THACA|nr:protein tyrosine kinase domain-containing protein [Rhizoctonia solani AG-1 IA]
MQSCVFCNNPYGRRNTPVDGGTLLSALYTFLVSLDLACTMLYTETSQETITGSHPYSEYGDHQLYFKLANKEHPKRSKEHFPETDKGGRMWSILLQCWDFDPTLRPTADQILASVGVTLKSVSL